MGTEKRRTVREVIVEELVRRSEALTYEAAETLIENMLHQEVRYYRGAVGVSCPRCREMLSLCEKHGLYVRTDENQCPACWRGE